MLRIQLYKNVCVVLLFIICDVLKIFTHKGECFYQCHVFGIVTPPRLQRGENGIAFLTQKRHKWNKCTRVRFGNRIPKPVSRRSKIEIRAPKYVFIRHLILIFAKHTYKNINMQTKILITGASGFIGASIVAKSLEQGYETWAGIRSTSNRDMLQDKRINFIDLNYADPRKLADELATFVNKNGKFDAIVHVAGITKAIRKAEFKKINYQYTKNFVDALVDLDIVPKTFVFMSSLGAIGVGDEVNYEPMLCDRIPNPNTAYGESKLLAENYLKSIPNFPYVILRPTGVYGPNDKDYLILIKAVKKGINVGAGFKKQILSFIYVDDLTDIVFTAINKEITRKEYFVSDGCAYTDDEFNKIVQSALNKKRVLKMKIPLFIVKAASVVSEKIGELFNKPVTFNTDKYKIMKQRNWACDITPLQKELDFTPKVYLEEGVGKTIAWYKERGWL